ncbi:MAG: iron-sulfur cluster assembly scaffold protein [Candidatus Cloacimonadota bacterium]|nr:MAG: iron-sulfur cluster assembly scaffold protein [Candidatus Cloacimonadota bacterium]
MTIKYSDKVIEHFQHPHNLGKLENADVEATEGSAACGDIVTVYLKVNPENHKITDIKFQSYGCASNIATGSIITDLAKGRTLEQAKKITWKQAADELGGLPPIKMHCSVLAVDTLHSAIKQYEKKYLGKVFDEHLNKKNIEEKLKSIIYPKVGLDIITLRMVKYVKLDENNDVLIEMTIDDEYKYSVFEHITNQLKNSFPEINKIKIVAV